ncbi:hypothetical protein LTS18_009578, partial [Coniosporium uncinatum]
MIETALDASTTATSNDDALQSPIPSQRQSWTCNSCHISFGTGQAQREHMKDPWHVYNLRRRIAELPPISLDTFRDQIQKTEPKSAEKETVREKTVDEEADHDFGSTHQCLFCPQNFESDIDADLENILEHMLTAHGLFIPDQTLISSLEAFLGYLATQ